MLRVYVDDIAKWSGLQHLLPTRFRSWFRHDSLLIIMLAGVAFHGILALGPALDDYYNREVYQTMGWALARQSNYNRAPMFFLVIYPLLLQLPDWLMRAPILAAHVTSTITLVALLRWFQIPRVPALISGLLLLLWPAHLEAVLWPAAAATTFGVCFVAIGGWLLVTKQQIPAAVLLFAGMLCLESIVLPCVYLIVLITIAKPASWRSNALLLIGLGVLYGAFQFVRISIAAGQSVTQYPTRFSIERASESFSQLSRIALGLASSNDVSWLWDFSFAAQHDVTQALPSAWLIVGLIVAGCAAIYVFRSPQISEYQTTAGRLGIVCVAASGGYLAATAIFMIVLNGMQSRYAYTGIVFLAILVGSLIGALVERRRAILRMGGIALFVLLVGWSLYRDWGLVWANWYPAQQVSQRIMHDVAATYQEHGISRIFLVNEPKAVGNAYALARDWAYGPAGRLIDPQLEVSADALPDQLRSGALGPGMVFSDRPCQFLGWSQGHHRVADMALSQDGLLVLNCTTGMIERAVQKLPEPFLQYTNEPGYTNLSRMLGNR